MTLFNTLKIIYFTSLTLIFISACTATPIVNSPLPTPISSTSTATPTAINIPSPTPTQTPSPTVTSTPSSTPTQPPTPMPTAAWTPTSLPTVIPYIQPAMTDLLPPIESDLLYLENGQLKLWNHATSQIKPLLSATDSLTNITQYSISADGQSIFFSRVMTMPNYQIGQLNLQTLQIKWLLNSAEPIMAWAISPDNQALAYIIQGNQPSTDLVARQLVPTPPPDKFGNYDVKSTIEGVLYSRNISTMQSIEIGFVSHVTSKSMFYSWSFNSLVWSPNSDSILWSDGYAVWSNTLQELKPRLLLPNELAMPNRKGVGVHTLGTWSPKGQYLMMETGFFEGSSFAIFDPVHGFILAIPDSFEYGKPGTRLVWMNNDDLFVIRPGEIYVNNKTLLPHIIEPMVGEIRHINTLSQSLTITRKAWFPIAAQPAFENIPFTLTSFEDGRLGFILTNEDNTNYLERGLYIVDADTLRPHKVNGLPPSPTRQWPNVIWNPDGSGAIIILPNQPPLYAPTDSSALYDLSSIISPQACCFSWLQK